MSVAPFNAQQSVVLNAQGYGFVTFRPAGTDWTVEYVSVSCLTKVKEAATRIYIGLIGQPYYVDGSNTGSTGDTSDTNQDVTDGTAFIVEWTGGDAGTTATARIRGKQQVGDNGRGFRAF